jgi:drug/metabolite transporter (DMT)-like permease
MPAARRRLWQQAAAVSEPQSLPANRFINSLDEMNKIQERRLHALRYHVPNAFVLMLLAVAMITVGFTGYHSGLTQTRPRLGTLILAVTVAFVIVGLVDLDQPDRGLIREPHQALVDVAKAIQP